MKIKGLLLMSSLFALSLISCGSKDSKNDDVVYSVPVATDIIELNNNNNAIQSIELEDVPKDKIEISYFSNAGIKLKINYVDGSNATVPVDEGFFLDYYEEFLTPGKKYFDLVYKNNHIPLKFELVEPIVPALLQVYFYDRNNTFLYRTIASYMGGCEYEGARVEDYIENGKYYKFVGWSKDINMVYRSINVTPVYEECDLYNSSELYYDHFTAYEPVANCHYTDTKGEHALLYSGRVNKLTLNELNVLERTSSKQTEFEFDKPDKKAVFPLLQEFGDTISKNLFVNNYRHIYNVSDGDLILINNSELLNFNVALTTDYELESGSLTTPSYMYNIFSQAGYTVSDNIKRKDGKYMSNKPLLNPADTEIFDKYFNDTAVTLTEDYPLGYYRLDFTCDIDVYLDLVYERDLSVVPREAYNLKSAKIILAYVDGTEGYHLRYSSDGDFTLYGMRLDITNYGISRGLYDIYH